MRRALALVLFPLLLLAACGSDDDGGGDEGADDTSSDASTDEATDTSVADVEEAGDDPVLDAVTVTGEFGEAPTIEFAQPFAAEATARRVLSEGDGDPVAAGDDVLLDFLALNGRDGAEFDNSFADGGAQEIPMNPEQVIPGIPRGVVGVPTGSRVLIAIAPEDGFGPMGGNPDVGIEEDDTLLFVVDVQEAREPLERAEGTPVEDLPEGLPTVELADDGEPTIEVPDEGPPTELVVQPLIEGEGAEVESGQTITVHYRGVLWRNGEEFDASWTNGEPAAFPIGTGSVIPGWDEGLVGQTIGSQVLLVVPPADGYGETGNPAGGIEGDDTLVFVVDILDAY